MLSEKQMCCPPNMTYVNKGNACPPTCKYPEGISNCPTKFVEGCQCAKGKVQDVDVHGNIRCIHPSKCDVCNVDGKIYIVGEKIFKDCQEW